MRQATLIAPDSWIVGFLVAGFLGSWFLALLQQLPELLAHFYFPSRATIAATFILLTRCFCHFCCFSFFLFFIFFGVFLPFQLAANKRRRQWKAWLGVIMSSNLLGHLEKYEKSTTANGYFASCEPWTFLIFLLPFSQQF